MMIHRAEIKIFEHNAHGIRINWGRIFKFLNFYSYYFISIVAKNRACWLQFKVESYNKTDHVWLSQD